MSDNSKNIGSVGGNVGINEAGGNITITNNYYTPSGKLARETDYLPYLLDRRPQEDQLIELVEEHTDFSRPILCVIRGKEADCCSDRFMQRMALDILPQIAKTKSQFKEGYGLSYIETDNARDGKELTSRIQRSLGASLLHDKTADLSSIADAIAKQERPHLLYATLTPEDYSSVGTPLIPSFLDFWQNTFAPAKNQRHLLLVCLFIYSQEQPAKGWWPFAKKVDLNQQIEQLLGTLTECAVLEKLEHIQKTHVEKWSQRDSMRQFFKRCIASEVHDELTKQFPNYSQGIPLDTLAKAIKPLLKKLAEEVSP